MFDDARLLPANTTFECDLCIVGGGPVGIALARGLADSGSRICLLEAGGHGQERQSQALLRGENRGLSYLPLNWTRLARFGGTTGWWGGECRPFDPVEDLEVRPWLDQPGWPVTRAEIAPFEAAACAFCGLSEGLFDDVPDPSGVDRRGPLPLDPAYFVTRLFRYGSPTDLALLHGPALAKAKNVRILLHAPATLLEADESGRRVLAIRFAGAPGAFHQVAARRVVLAAGGIENPRLLLESGLGNGHVGRCFMEHLYLDDIARFTPSATCPLMRRYARRSNGPRGPFKAALAPTASLLAETGAANCCFKFASPLKRERAVVAALQLRHGFTSGHLPTPPAQLAWQVARGVPALGIECARSIRSGELGSAERPRTLPVSMVVEQLPDPENRITLSTRRDELGRRLARLDWWLGEGDRAGWQEVLARLGQELAHASLGRLERGDEPAGQVMARLRPACHHMGTTRMSTDGSSGVVDRQGRVHGSENLYVAGSSVFPTAGHANPMLTAITLTLRLAAHLATLDGYRAAP